MVRKRSSAVSTHDLLAKLLPPTVILAPVPRIYKGQWLADGRDRPDHDGWEESLLCH